MQFKGIVLSNFFKKVLKREKLPTHILFVDDQKSNLESVKKCCDIWSIDFTGILFKPEKEELAINPDAIRQQFDIFEKTGVWVGDDTPMNNPIKTSPLQSIEESL